MLLESKPDYEAIFKVWYIFCVINAVFAFVFYNPYLMGPTVILGMYNLVFPDNASETCKEILYELILDLS